MSILLNCSGNQRHIENALRLAIGVLEIDEKSQGYLGDSAILATWRQQYFELTGIRIEREETERKDRG